MAGHISRDQNIYYTIFFRFGSNTLKNEGKTEREKSKTSSVETDYTANHDDPGFQVSPQKLEKIRTQIELNPIL